jgi:hypothetical protein
MFIVPLWVGIGAAVLRPSASINLALRVAELSLFIVTVFGFFLLRYPLMLAVKSRARPARAQALRWAVIYGAMTGAGGALLLVLSRQLLLVPIGLLGLLSLGFYLGHASRREEMSTLGEWTGIAGLALGAPGAYLILTGTLDATALLLYLFNLLYFGGTVAYVKFKVRVQPRVIIPSGWGPRLWAGRVTIAYHAVVILLVALLALIGWAPALAPIAFVPAFCKSVGGVVTRPARLSLRRLGLVELVFTVAFAFVVLLAYR